MKRKKITIQISTFLVISMLLVGCKKEVVDNKPTLVISYGSVIAEKNGGYSNLNLKEQKYENISGDKLIVLADKESGNYIFNKEGKLYYSYEGVDKPIMDSNIASAHLAPGGRYLSYFTNNDFYELKVLDLKTGKNLEAKSTVSISGTVLCWLDSDTIVYYGISDNEENGIFAYDIKDSKEELIYSVNEGYVEFIKSQRSGAIFIQQSLENEKVIKAISQDKKVSDVGGGFTMIKDVEITEKGIFVLGKTEKDSYSLYQLVDGIPKRLVYDFPKKLVLEKGLSSDEQGNILFIGEDTDTKTEGIYTYEDGYIKNIYSGTSEYNFVDVN